ncbi:MAG: DEAD/DEAH box helicase [Chloroflexi bacterium]|nr:DEAD/DEAH box helicase [Chloroflexota bacterium]
MTTLSYAPTTPLALRDFQREAVDRSVAALEEGCRRQLGVAATGLGKTVIFCALAQRLGLPTLILAHRDELIAQAVEKVQWAWPGARVGVVQASRDEWREDVVVASVQTISRQARLDRIPPRFGLIVVDEAHHAAAETYQRVLGHFQDGAAQLTLGVTATPDRGDRKGLTEHFDRIVWNYDILWGIAQGWLADLRGLRVGLDVDLDNVATRGGDFVEGQLGAALEAADAPEHVADAWVRHATGRRGIVFCPTIALAQRTAASLNARGLAAGSVSGVDLAERRSLLSRLRAGRLDVVTNCAVLTEGFDEPSIDCIAIARPTKSRALYAQMIGRGTRPFPGKDDCLVLDAVGVTGRHELVTIPSLFGLKKGGYPADGRLTVTEAVAAQQEREVKAGQLRAAEVDLLRTLRQRRLVWVKAGAAFAAPAGDRIVVLQGSGEQWSARALGRGLAPLELAGGTTLERAQGVAETYVRENAPAKLADPKAPWRRRPPTEKALAAAGKWRVRIDPSWNAGQLSDAMNAKIAEVRMSEALRTGGVD